jgi:hypothetical protein
VGNEDRIRHGSIRPDTAADAVVPLALVVIGMNIVGALVCLVALVMHVPYARLCGGVAWTAPRTGDTGQVAAGSGAVPRGTHQLSVQPGPGAMCRAKDVAADVGNDAKRDHVHVHQPHYSEQIRKEAR